VFVAKREVAGWPLFGLLAKLNRSVFVERERRTKTADVNREIAARMSEGDPVVLFAEGTSSDGNRVLSFRSSLIGAVQAALAVDFRAAPRNGSPPSHAGGENLPLSGEGAVRSPLRGETSVCIQPLSIAYVGIDGFPMGRQHRPQVAWYGAMDLLPHLAGIIRHGAIDVVVSWGTPRSIDSSVDRKAIARESEAEVRRLTTNVLRGRENRAEVAGLL
jgi:1-acyl-sn-glycerol-3-phosphate acyltransferase